MSRPLSHMKAAARLLDAANEWIPYTPDEETILRRFYDQAMALISRVDCMPWNPNAESKPGYEEWCEFRAVIYVSWSLYWHRHQGNVSYFPHPREHYKPNFSEAFDLLNEVVGKRPRQGRARWLAGVEERCRTGVKEIQSEAGFDSILGSLLHPECKYPKEYREIFDRLKAEWLLTHESRSHK